MNKLLRMNLDTHTLELPVHIYCSYIVHDTVEAKCARDATARMKNKDDGLAELYNSKFKEAITSLSAWRERLENPQQEKSKEMLKEAGEVVQTLKTDMAAWKKLEDVYAPSSASTDVTPSGPRKRKASQHSGSKRGAPKGERKACLKGAAAQSQ